MKKLTVLILVLFALLFTGCADTTDDEPKAATPEELTALIYDELDSYLGTDADFNDLVSFLDEWTGSNKLPGTKYNNGCYIIERSASKGCENAKSMTLECSVGSTISTADIEKLSFLLYNVGITEKHPDIKAVICTEKGERNLPAELLTGDRFINVKYGEDLALVNASPAFSRFSLKKKISWTKPQFTVTYNVSINGLSGDNVEDLTVDKINPIKVLAEILTNYKSSGNLFEISEFGGGISSDKYPSYAHFTVSIPENEIASFEKAVNKQIEKTENQLDEISPDYSFVINRVMPKNKVMSEESSSDFLAMLFILSEGSQQYNEYDDIDAFINLGKVRLGRSAARIEVRNYSMDEELLEYMDNETVSLAEIPSFDAVRLSSGHVWKIPEDDPLQTEILESKKLDLVEAVSICPRVKELSPETDCVCMVINSNKWKRGNAIMANVLAPKEK